MNIVNSQLRARTLPESLDQMISILTRHSHLCQLQYFKAMARILRIIHDFPNKCPNSPRIPETLYCGIDESFKV
jgi:hypothetical protein